MIVFGACAGLAALFQINPIWLFGPYEPRNVSAGSQPDWYMGFLDGSSRLMPGWEIRLAGHTIPPIVWPAVILPGILMTLVGGYPWIEQKLTGDRSYHHLLDRPRDRPVRTSAGAAFIAFYISLWLSGGNDILAAIFHISLNATTFGGRALVLLSPPITYLVTHRICLALQGRDAAVEDHGVETGFIQMSPDGQYAEIHAPKPHVEHAIPIPVMPDELPALPAGSGNGGSGHPMVTTSTSRASAERFAQPGEGGEAAQ
jgi:ubiquinol-cytochrome c reductase cytochrome b subunit